jgi:hypothetical protein
MVSLKALVHTKSAGGNHRWSFFAKKSQKNGNLCTDCVALMVWWESIPKEDDGYKLPVDSIARSQLNDSCCPLCALVYRRLPKHKENGRIDSLSAATILARMNNEIVIRLDGRAHGKIVPVSIALVRFMKPLRQLIH